MVVWDLGRNLLHGFQLRVQYSNANDATIEAKRGQHDLHKAENEKRPVGLTKPVQGHFSRQARHLMVVRQVNSDNCFNSFVLRWRMRVVRHQTAACRPGNSNATAKHDNWFHFSEETSNKKSHVPAKVPDCETNCKRLCLYLLNQPLTAANTTDNVSAE